MISFDDPPAVRAYASSECRFSSLKMTRSFSVSIATPSNVPLIGRTRYPNLYLNAGHGTLGWTMAAGSGKAIAEIVSGRKPDIAFAFLGY